jgi:hypothetical protein
MSQQQNPKSIQLLPDYQTAFNQRIVPVDLKGHNYVNAQNIKFTDSLDQIASYFLLVDSSARNWDTEDTNNYTIFLPEELQYVHSIELVDGFVPNTGYVITDHNNTFYFQETPHQVRTQTYYIASIKPGNYTITELLNELKTCMHEASQSSSKYHLTLDQTTDKITVCTNDDIGTGVFNLIFNDGTEVIGDRSFMETLVIDPITNRKKIEKVEVSNSRRKYPNNSIGKILGFKADNLTGQLSYTGQMLYKLRADEYIALFVNTENDEDFKQVIAPSIENGANKAFAIIQLDRDNEYFNITSERKQIIENIRYIRTFNPPISFSKVKIQYRSSNGHLYNFNGIDNYLVFEIKRVYDRSIITKLEDLK